MTSGSGRATPSSSHRAKATLSTAIPVSAARVAAGSATPRSCSAAAIAVPTRASLISSRSCRSGCASMMTWRCGAMLARPCSAFPAASRPAATASSAVAVPGAAATAPTTTSWNASWPENSTSRLSAKCRKNVRSVSPARTAMSATVVWSKPRSANSSAAACSSRPRASGSHRLMPRF